MLKIGENVIIHAVNQIVFQMYSVLDILKCIGPECLVGSKKKNLCWVSTVIC